MKMYYAIDVDRPLEVHAFLSARERKEWVESDEPGLRQRVAAGHKPLIQYRRAMTGTIKSHNTTMIYHFDYDE